MATTRKSELVITCNATAIKDVMTYLNRQLGELIRRRDELTSEANHFGWTKEAEKEFKQLGDDIAAITSMQQKNREEMVKYAQVMQDLANSKLKDVRSALNEVKRALSNVSENDPKRERLNKDLARLAEQMDVIGSKKVTLEKANAALKDLVNTPTDKLRQGLAAIRQELEREPENTQWSNYLKGAEKKYAAQIAINENGRAGNAPLMPMNNEQLVRERTRLTNLYNATDGVKGYEAVSQEAIDRLHQVNQLIKDRADAEREAARAKREAEREAEKAAEAAAAAEQKRLDWIKQGQQTHKTLTDMEKASYEDLDNALKHLETQRQKYIQSGDTKHIQRNLQMQDKLKQKMQEMQKLMLSEKQINDRVTNSRKYNVIELQQAYDQLKYKLTTLHTGEQQQIKETRRQMKTLEKGINSVKGEATGLTKIWQTAVRNISTYMGVFAAFNFAKSKMQEMIKKNYELSDSIMNVRKVSGLTIDDINQLYNKISKIDTRNTINTLMNLAYQGGKLGIGSLGVDQLTGFVKAAEQVQMALGEDLGEEALPALAKLTENMGLIKEMGVEQAMQKTASAMFMLSTTSVSTGQGIVDFAKRLMPVAKAANVTTPELLGLASATESSGLAAEVAATAFVKMFPSIYKNASALESYLGLEKGYIRDMYDQNQAMQAMVTIFDKMKQMGNINKYPELFKLLGSEGARMNTVMTAMANNVDMVRTHLKTSNDAFAEGTAVINEYMLQNASAAGILERANNIWEKAFVNPEGVDMVKELAQEWYNFSQQLTQSETWMYGVKTSLAAIAWVVETLIRLLPVLIKSFAFYGIAATVRKIWVEFTLLNSAMTAAAGTAGKLGAFFKSNIWVLAATAIGFAATALIDMAMAGDKADKSMKKLSQSEKDYADAQKMVGEYTRKEVGHLDALYRAATDTLQPMNKRLEWVKQMKQEWPDVFKGLSDEAILTGRAAAKYKELAENLMKAAKARAYKDKMDQISEESLKLQEEIDTDLDYLNQNEKRYKNEKAAQERRDKSVSPGASIFGGTAALSGMQSTAANDDFLYHYEQRENTVLEKQAQIAKNDERIRNLAAKVMENTTPTTTTPTETFTPGPVGDTDTGGKGGAGAEYREEQQKAKAIIDNIKNYYQRQMNALNELANETDMSEGDLKGAMDRLQEHMNDALSNARRAIGGEKNEWEKFKADMRRDLYEQTDAEGYNFSEQLLDYIMDNQLEELRSMILKLSTELNKQGNVLLDQILRKATEDEAKNIRMVTSQRKLLQKELLEKNYTGKVDLATQNTLESLGIGSFNAEQSRQLQQWKQTGNVDEAKKFFAQRERDWAWALEMAREHILEIINSPIEKEGDGENLLKIMFGPQYSGALKNSTLDSFLSMSLDEWRVFYTKLIDYSDQWTDAQRKAYEENKKRQDYLFGNRSDIIAIDNASQLLQQSEQERNRFGEPATFGRQMGMVDTVSDDPELMRLDLLQARAEMYYSRMAELRAQDKISEEQLTDAKDQMTQAQIAMQDKLMDVIKQRTDTITTAIEPITDFAENAGQKLGDMMTGMESQSMTWNQIWKNMLLAMGKSIIQMGQQYAIQKLQRGLFNKQVEADEEMHQALLTTIALGGALARMQGELAIEKGALVMKKMVDGEEVTQEISLATILTSLGISEGAAKTIGKLGWWGIPLVAVISSLLMGLLSSALSTAGSESASSASSTSATATKTKLVSGMLTYDEGNVGTYQGTDGQSYHATQVSAPADGLVTQPIATTVQGQPALVAERGPEIVIGRRTTRAIMMNEPGLIRYLANYGKSAQAGSRYRAFDGGNLDDITQQLPDGQPTTGGGGITAADAQKLVAAIGAFNQTVNQMQQKGIPCYINKYGSGGLIDEVKSGMKFDSKYNK